MEPTFSIADISSRTGLSYDTIRYYEKIGLLPSPGRKKNGQREYTSSDLDRFTFVTHLKRTHMPLKEIERYIAYSIEQNYEACYSVLHEHKKHLQAQLAEMNETLNIINYKLDNFQGMTKR
ncbi:MerR family transcriptional regulator [Paenibacillus sp. TAB 01]|uniref:MerR family transcriptional regulator n=1 Tax=Paenibacillus sp. TAB 01 TaxID=3368988 RepID=UPI003751CF76